ncbi:MAG: NAD(P)H-dependent oxidoreductase [Lentilitoribacter sp.]
MTQKRIFILNGHPAENSLSKLIAETYLQEARNEGHDVRISHLHDMNFDIDHGYSGYKQHKDLEPDLLAFRQDIEWAQHIVLTTPMWWGGMPAKLKGVFDRAFLPGWAFDTRKTKLGMPLPMLSGRAARIFVTSDTPGFFFWLLYRNALLRQIRGQIFHFCGIKPARITHFAPAGAANQNQIEKWLKVVRKLGSKAQ